MEHNRRIPGTRWKLVKTRISQALRVLRRIRTPSKPSQRNLFGYSVGKRIRPVNRTRLSSIRRKMLRHHPKIQQETPAVIEKSVPAKLVQLDLFAVLPEPVMVRPKFTKRIMESIKRKARKKKRALLQDAKLQYKIPLTVTKKQRQRAFNTRVTEVEANDIVWTKKGIRQLHYVLLTQSIATIKEHIEIKSSKAAEIWAWIEKEGYEEDFSFDTCVAIAGEFDPEYANMDPELLRSSLRRILIKQFGVEFPHANLLKKGIKDAESGNQDAIEWVISDSEEPLSFIDCCESLGFNPEKAREEIYIDPVDLLKIA